MLTQAPLPAWKVLLSAFFLSKPSIDNQLHPWVKKGETAGWFSRSAWSLAKIAQWRIKYHADKGLSVWVPDYYCNA